MHNYAVFIWLSNFIDENYLVAMLLLSRHYWLFSLYTSAICSVLDSSGVWESTPYSNFPSFMLAQTISVVLKAMPKFPFLSIAITPPLPLTQSSISFKASSEDFYMVQYKEYINLQRKHGILTH